MADTRKPGILKRMRDELRVYQMALKDLRTPRPARWLLGLAIAYLISPIDIIPDFIPLAGQLDDLIVVPVLIWLAIRLIPSDVLSDCRQAVAGQNV